MSPPNTWTAAQVELLKALWITNASCSQIAREMGGGMTRNAVISKVHRLGLSARQARLPRQGKSPTWRAPTLRPNPPAPPRAEPVGFVDLRLHHCRWPLGAPHERAVLFCGAKRDESSPYCGYHRDLSIRGAA